MDARKLRHFLTVATEGSFTKAAEALHIAQPSLSQSIRALEQELKTPLFRRLPRSLRLTAAGEALVAPARRALRAMRDAEEAVRAVAGLQTGRLEITAPRALSVYPTAGLIAAFHRRHPGVVVQVVEATGSVDAGEKVNDGTAEVAVLELSLLPRGLRSWPLVDYQLQLVLPPGMTAPTGDAVSRDLVAELPLVGLPAGTVSRRMIDELGANEAVKVEARSTNALIELVLDGVGAALVIEPYAAAAVARGAHAIPLTPPMVHSVGLAVGAADPAPAAQEFVRTALHGRSSD